MKTRGFGVDGLKNHKEDCSYTTLLSLSEKVTIVIYFLISDLCLLLWNPRFPHTQQTKKLAPFWPYLGSWKVTTLIYEWASCGNPCSLSTDFNFHNFTTTLLNLRQHLPHVLKLVTFENYLQIHWKFVKLYLQLSHYILLVNIVIFHCAWFKWRSWNLIFGGVNVTR